MLEEEIDFQAIDECKLVELQDEQEIEVYHILIQPHNWIYLTSIWCNRQQL